MRSATSNNPAATGSLHCNCSGGTPQARPCAPAGAPAVELEAIANTAYRLPFDFSADLQNLGADNRSNSPHPSCYSVLGRWGLLIGLYLARARLPAVSALARLAPRPPQRLAGIGRLRLESITRALKTSAVPFPTLVPLAATQPWQPTTQRLSEHLPAPQAQALRQALAARYAAADKAHRSSTCAVACVPCAPRCAVRASVTRLTVIAAFESATHWPTSR